MEDAFNSFLGFVQAGFNDMRTNVMAIVIAFVVAFFVMKKWGQLLIMWSSPPWFTCWPSPSSNR